MATLFPERILDLPLSRFPGLWQNFLNADLLPMAEEFPANGTRIYEENNQLFVEVPLPGLNTNDIEVSLNKGVLHVNGESKEEEEDKQKKYYRSSSRKYSYSFVLPTQTDDKQEPQAVYTDGILKISLQLAKQAETKKISVKAGNSKK